MNTKKPLSILLTLALVLGLLPWTVMPARAEDAKEMTQTTLEWSGSYTVNSTMWMSGSVTVTDDTTVTISAGKTLGLSEYVITVAEGKTLTVAGQGRLKIQWPDGSDGTDYDEETGSGATDGENAPAAFTGSLIVKSGTVEITGGNGGKGGNHENGDAGKGGDGGAGVKGSIVVEGGTVKIEGGTAGNGGKISDQSTGDKGTGGIGVDGSVTVKGGVVSVTGGDGVGDNSRGSAGGAGITGAVTLGGGTLTVSHGENDYYYNGDSNPAYGGTVTVEDSWRYTLNGAGNHTAFTTEQLNAVDTATLAPASSIVARVGETAYSNVQDAIDGASADSAESAGVVKLLRDVTINAPLPIRKDKYVVLDLDGHTIDRGLADVNNMNDLNGNDGYVLRVAGALTLTDRSEARTGAITGGNNGTWSVDAAPGGVLVEQGGTLTMNGGAISGNKTYYESGGGVYVANGGTLKLYGGAISGNNATNFGGGVCVADGGAFELHGGTISGNSAGSGGGVMVYGATGAFTMDDGAICGNSADRGGGVYVEGAFGMSGGSVTGNNCADDDNYYQGGGVYVAQGGGFAVSGGASVTDNFRGGTRAADGKYAAGESGTANNVYLSGDKSITVADALTENAGIGVTSGGLSVFTSGWSTYMSEADPAGCFTSDDACYVVMRSDDGEAELRFLNTVTVENGTADKATAVEGETVTVTANAPATGKVFDRWTADDDDVEFADAGKAQTTFTMPWGDVTVTATYKNPSYTVTLNTNGGTINGGNVTGYTYGAETALPTDVTRDGFIFGGWYAKSDLSGSPVTKIAATETGNKTFYAKWTEKNTVTVNSGTGGGSYAEGATVKVTANAPATSKVFDRWTSSDGVTFADAYSAATTFTMPAQAVAVTATYHDYSLANGKVYAPKGAVLICATYSGGRMTGMQSVTINADCADKAPSSLGLTVPASGYKLMLVDGSTFAPLCAAWEKKA